MTSEGGHFGGYLRMLRKEKRVTLREFCRRTGADPGNVSKMERGQLPPPQDSSTLETYAEALGVEVGTDEWQELVDLAAIDRGIIPHDLMSDQELVNALPAFFRTLRGQTPNEDEMKSLVDKIRRS